MLVGYFALPEDDTPEKLVEAAETNLKLWKPGYDYLLDMAVGLILRAKENTEMKYYLAKFRKNWADEFDVHGFTVISEAEKLGWEMLVRNHRDMPIEAGFGTNQGWGEYHAVFLPEFMEAWEFTEISETEADTYRKHFQTPHCRNAEFGTCMTIPDLFENYVDGVDEFPLTDEEIAFFRDVMKWEMSDYGR